MRGKSLRKCKGTKQYNFAGAKFFTASILKLHKEAVRLTLPFFLVHHCFKLGGQCFKLGGGANIMDRILVLFRPTLDLSNQSFCIIILNLHALLFAYTNANRMNMHIAIQNGNEIEIACSNSNKMEIIWIQIWALYNTNIGNKSK